MSWDVCRVLLVFSDGINSSCIDCEDNGGVLNLIIDGIGVVFDVLELFIFFCL